MNLLIKSVTIIDPGSTHHQQMLDVLIQDGIITKIASNIAFQAPSIDGNDRYLVPGFFDLNCNIGALGLEMKEDLTSGTQVAAAGGFTGLALMPNTYPPIHSKAEVSYLLNQAKGNLVDVYPLGTVSQDRAGKVLAEMYDMHCSGARAFTDGDRPIQDADLMKRALLYTQGFDALVFSYPEDSSLAGMAQVHEGIISTQLGIPGIPDLAETLMITRDLYLAAYTDAKLHFSTVSTANSVTLIREAKKRGLRITCDVAAHHLVLTDACLQDFNSQYKVKPPLRTKSDVQALISALKDGTIDAIVSQHSPHEVECKNVAFESASFGIIGLQTVFPLALLSKLPLSTLVEKLSINPRKILNLDSVVIEIGHTANIALVDVAASWIFDTASNRSKSSNSPYIGQELKGKVILTYNNKQMYVGTPLNFNGSINCHSSTKRSAFFT